jgi:hypothetical protein
VVWSEREREGALEGHPIGRRPNVKYVMLIMDTPEGREQYEGNKEWFAEVGDWYEKTGASGKLADGGAQLQPANTARTVRGSGVTDGPYIETKEVVGGFSVLDVASMNEAVEIAKTWPGVDRGWITVELRPLVEMG